MRIKTLRATAVALLVGGAIVAAGCGDDERDTASSGSTQKQFVAQPPGGIKGALLPSERSLWTYDAATGKYTVADGDASGAYEPSLEKPSGQVTIAYQDPWAANAFAIPIRDGVQEIGKRLGIKIIYCDSAFKPDQAVNCAELLARQKPDFAIAGNWQAGAASALMKIYDKARIPTVVEDVWHPNSIFFGADNYTSGVVAGKAAGEYAKETWDCKDVWIFNGLDETAGEAPGMRLSGFSDGVQEVCGELPEDQDTGERMTAGTADQALTVTTDWLTAHPQAQHVLSTAIDDERSSGVAKAFVADGRDAMSVGQGCDAVGVEVVKQAPPAENHYLGCVAYFPEKYAEYLVGIGLDVLAGDPVPNEVHLEHKFLTHETIGEYYP